MVTEEPPAEGDEAQEDDIGTNSCRLHATVNCHVNSLRFL